MTTRKEKKILADIWQAFSYRFDNLSWTGYARRLLALTTEETRQHDRFRGPSIRRGMTLADEARYFALLRLAEYGIAAADTPPLERFFSMQHSCYAAWAIVNAAETKDHFREFAEEHRAALEEILTWDYCRLIADNAEAA